MNILLFVLLLALACRLLLRTPIVDMFLPIYSYLTMTQDRLFRLLSIVIEAFQQYDIPYAITGTTLLGAITLQNFLPKDRTIQLIVPAEHIGKIMSLQNQFYKSMGLGISDLPDGGIRIGGAFALPFMDDSSVRVIPIVQAGERWIGQSRSLLSEYYDKDELFPTKLYPLGTLDVAGPTNPLPYLQRNFGGSSVVNRLANVREARVPVIKRGSSVIIVDSPPLYDDRLDWARRGLRIPSSRQGITDLRNAFRRREVLNRFPRGSAVVTPLVGTNTWL